MQKIVSSNISNSITKSLYWLITNNKRYEIFRISPKKNGILSKAKTFVQITRLDISTCLIFTTPNPNEKIWMVNERLR